MFGSVDIGSTGFATSAILRHTAIIFITILYAMGYVRLLGIGRFRACIGLLRRGCILLIGVKIRSNLLWITGSGALVTHPTRNVVALFFGVSIHR